MKTRNICNRPVHEAATKKTSFRGTSKRAKQKLRARDATKRHEPDTQARCPEKLGRIQSAPERLRETQRGSERLSEVQRDSERLREA